jgi:2-haloacid dehalogenase
MSDLTDVEALCFDMYCTTHDTHSVTATLREATDRPDAVIDAVSHLWRETKIDLSRKIALMDETEGSERGNYVTWWELMTRALDYALEYYGIDFDDGTREEVIDTYNHLDPYEPGWESFERIQEAGYELYILSNGNYDMLDRLASNTGQDEYLNGLISGEEARAFKPHPAIYETAIDSLDRDPEQLLMVASHSWDTAGAANVGMQSAFVNRRHLPVEPLGAENTDFDLEVESFEELADELE